MVPEMCWHGTVWCASVNKVWNKSHFITSPCFIKSNYLNIFLSLTISFLPAPPSTHLSPQEIGLLGLTEAADAHVGKQLLLKDVLGVLDPVFPGHPGLGSPYTDEVEGNVLFLDHKRLIQRRLQLWRGESRWIM